MDDYHLQSLLASILYQEGKRSEAAQLARTLTDRYPSEGEAQYILAVLAADADRLDEAARLVRSAASRRLTPQTRANAVSIAADLGDIELAESLARQAVQDAPRDPRLRILVATIAERRDKAEAARLWRVAERHRRRISSRSFRNDIIHYRSLVAKLISNQPPTAK